MMKNKLLLLLGAVTAFASSSLVAYKLMNPYPRYIHLTAGSFRDLYEDNAESLKDD